VWAFSVVSSAILQLVRNFYTFLLCIQGYQQCQDGFSVRYHFFILRKTLKALYAVKKLDIPDDVIISATKQGTQTLNLVNFGHRLAHFP
jgi:hypothetical protein